LKAKFEIQKIRSLKKGQKEAAAGVPGSSPKLQGDNRFAGFLQLGHDQA
jgi:hypothetical protein